MAGSGFASSLAGRKVDNHAARAPAKVALRRALLAEIGAGKAHVLDAFAGAGAMHRAVWHEAASYVGCDLRWFGGERPAHVVDNMRLLRCLNLDRFTVFDLDAYGSPWKQATIMAARRQLAPGERIGLALTDGSVMRARLGAVPTALAEIAAVSPSLAGANRIWRDLTARALEEVARRMGGRLEGFWAAETGSRPILYSTAVLAGR